jgi:hypothetical protein
MCLRSSSARLEIACCINDVTADLRQNAGANVVWNEELHCLKGRGEEKKKKTSKATARLRSFVSFLRVGRQPPQQPKVM